MKTIRAISLAALLLLIGRIAHSQQAAGNSPKAFDLQGETKFVHDPSIIKEGDVWYVFSTGTGPDKSGQLPIHCSTDLHNWKQCGHVLETIPEWIQKESPGTKGLWAPDISYFNGLYHLYYAFSLFGKNTSGIALLTNKTLDPASKDFHWEDRGLVLRSQAEDDFNAIDPNLVLDNKGRAWLSLGSFWTGIKMRRIDPKTGLLSNKDKRVYSLAKRQRPDNPTPTAVNLPANWQAIEAPFIVHHANYYYLFVSFDLCCRGTKSNYKTMVGRSPKVNGPYVDADGKAMLEGGGTLLLSSNETWIGPGGESILQQKEGDIIVFHAYDAERGRPSLQISPLEWVNGWPKAALQDGGNAKSSSEHASIASD